MQTEGAVGYASCVCSVMNDESKMNTDSYRYAICQMSAVTAASDALAKYTGKCCPLVLYKVEMRVGEKIFPTCSRKC